MYEAEKNEETDMLKSKVALIPEERKWVSKVEKRIEAMTKYFQLSLY